MHPRFVLSCLLTILLVAGSSPGASPIPVLFDTDMMGDVDDVGAVAVLHALADKGDVAILATGVCTKHPASPLCLDALNRFYGRANLPVGVVKGPAFAKKSRYANGIAKEWPHRFDSVDDVPDVVKVYRKALAGAKDGSVVLITVGQLTNVRDLLNSKPDEHSDLSGTDLVKKKVRTWVCMGGKFPGGREANLVNDGPAAYAAIRDWPGPIIFSGWEIGQKIITGRAYAKVKGPHAAKRAYFLFNEWQGRQSWDQTAVLYAGRGLDGGLGEVWDLSPPGRMVIEKDGVNGWQTEEGGPHRYLVEKMEPGKVGEMIEKLMVGDN